MTHEQKTAKYGPVVMLYASRSAPDTVYEVRGTLDALTCNCKTFIFGKSCLHVRAFTASSGKATIVQVKKHDGTVGDVMVGKKPAITVPLSAGGGTFSTSSANGPTAGAAFVPAFVDEARPDVVDPARQVASRIVMALAAVKGRGRQVEAVRAILVASVGTFGAAVAPAVDAVAEAMAAGITRMIELDE